MCQILSESVEFRRRYDKYFGVFFRFAVNKASCQQYFQQLHSVSQLFLKLSDVLCGRSMTTSAQETIYIKLYTHFKL